MRERRRPTRPKVDSKLFDQLPDHLKKAILNALGKSEAPSVPDFSSSSQMPPSGTEPPAPERAPAVVFYSFSDFLENCSLETLDRMFSRYYGMTQEQREIVRRRLKLPLELVPNWIRWADERFNSVGRTDQPERGDS